MSDDKEKWVPIATYPDGIQADIAVARLEAAGIWAVRHNNDRSGIFGPGFEGASAQGITVLVPSDALHAAEKVLGQSGTA